MAWTDWMSLENSAIKEIPNDPGVYRIALREEISRLSATDPEGLLLIGKSVNVGNRVRKFIGSAFDDIPGHVAGERFDLLDLSDELGARRSDLHVSWFASESKDGASKLEETLLNRYQIRFGEVPPLNNSGGLSVRRMDRPKSEEADLPVRWRSEAPSLAE